MHSDLNDLDTADVNLSFFLSKTAGHDKSVDIFYMGEYNLLDKTWWEHMMIAT